MAGFGAFAIVSPHSHCCCGDLAELWLLLEEDWHERQVNGFQGGGLMSQCSQADNVGSLTMWDADTDSFIGGLVSCIRSTSDVDSY